MAIHDAVLRSGRTLEDNRDGIFAKYFYTLQPFPETAEDFLHASSRQTLDYYREDNQKGFHVPPLLNHNLHYQRTLQKYYDVVEKFVSSVLTIDEVIKSEVKQDVDSVMNEVYKYMRVLEENRCDPIKFFSTFIWQVSILHPIEHFAGAQMFSDQEDYQGLKTVLSPGMSTPSLVLKSLKECDDDTKPIDVADSLYFDRFRNFGNVFAQFHHNPDLDLTMDKLQYDFAKGSTAANAVTKFQQDLLDLEDELIERITLSFK